MPTCMPASLPGGIWVDGKLHRNAELRKLTAEDELTFVEMQQPILNVQRVTELLTRCLARVGPIDLVTPEMVRLLTIGDREALLLQLRRLEMGDQIDGMIRCPHEDCGERMDLSMNVGDLLLPPYENGWPSDETTISVDGRDYLVRFRLPTGGDQEDASILYLSDPLAARDLILRRCVLEVVPDDGAGLELNDMSPIAMELLPSILLEHDPQAELRLDLICPECGCEFSTIFDVASFLLKELEVRSAELLREVHSLAYYYHWSEIDILTMTSKRRRMYLEMLADALSRRNRG